MRQAQKKRCIDCGATLDWPDGLRCFDCVILANRRQEMAPPWGAEGKRLSGATGECLVHRRRGCVVCFAGKAAA